MSEDKSLNKVKGAYGEDMACQYLLDHGQKIVARNYQCRFGEVDLITTQAQVLHFVEVKNRSTDLVPGRYAVNHNKQKHIRNVAMYFLTQYPNYRDWVICFDVIEITDGQIDYLENCFY